MIHLLGVRWRRRRRVQETSRKRARSSSIVISRFPSDSSDIHQVTRVPYQDRGRCKLCTKQKIDSRTCTRCDDCNLFLCQTNKKFVSENGILVLRATFYCKICVCINLIVMLFNKAG